MPEEVEYAVARSTADDISNAIALFDAPRNDIKIKQVTFTVVEDDIQNCIVFPVRIGVPMFGFFSHNVDVVLGTGSTSNIISLYLASELGYPISMEPHGTA